MAQKYFPILTIIAAVACLCHLESCNQINPPETIPCYGHVDSIGLTTNIATQGSNSANISCAWVYVDDQPVGTFELSNTFPILASNGSHLITIIPGVTADGASSTREQYPFYTTYNSNVNLTQGSKSHFSYTATYTSSTQFAWIEDFDHGAGFSIITDTIRTISSTHMVKVGAPNAYQGNSGQVVLDSNASHNYTQFVGYSDTMTLPTNGTSVFMELNYNNNATFGVGVAYGSSYAVSPIGPVFVYILPSNGWKKLYIDLGSAVANQTNTEFTIYFYFQRPVGQQQATLLLDNIKVLHLKG